MKENDKVMYCGEQFTVAEITANSVIIENDAHRYYVQPIVLAQVVEEPIEEAEVKKSSRKKK